jgi:hypothetical protein
MSIELATPAEHGIEFAHEVMARKTMIARHVALAMRDREIKNPFCEGTPAAAEWDAAYAAALKSDVLEGSEA